MHKLSLLLAVSFASILTQSCEKEVVTTRITTETTFSETTTPIMESKVVLKEATPASYEAKELMEKMSAEEIKKLPEITIPEPQEE